MFIAMDKSTHAANSSQPQKTNNKQVKVVVIFLIC